MDDVFIERLWRSLKYECIYLHAYDTGSELRAGVTTWVAHDNTGRPHSALGGRTPNEVYAAGTPPGGGQAPHPAAHLPLAA